MTNSQEVVSKVQKLQGMYPGKSVARGRRATFPWIDGTFMSGKSKQVSTAALQTETWFFDSVKSEVLALSACSSTSSDFNGRLATRPRPPERRTCSRGWMKPPGPKKPGKSRPCAPMPQCFPRKCRTQITKKPPSDAPELSLEGRLQQDPAFQEGKQLIVVLCHPRPAQPPTDISWSTFVPQSHQECGIVNFKFPFFWARPSTMFGCGS